MSEQNKSVVRRMLDEIWNKKNMGKLDEFFSPQFSGQTPDGPLNGLQEYKRFHEAYSNAFPDCKIEIAELLAEGDGVCVRYIFSGTHKGELRGIVPTGRKLREPGMSLMRIADGRIVEEVGAWDRLSLLEQLGAASGGMTQVAGGR